MKVYLDIYFILNFIMNYFLMCITAVFRQKRMQPCWWALVSCAGSVLSTGIYAWSCIQGMGILLLDLVGLPVMTAVAYRTHNVFVWLRDTVSYILAAMLTGGCLYAVLSGIAIWQNPASPGSWGRQEYSIWLVLFGVLLLSVVFLLLGKEILYQAKFQKNTGEARVVHRGKKLQIRILYDSGNQLVSPYTGERVAVISQSLAEQLEITEEQHPVYIPYRSIGGGGILPAYRIERLEWQERDDMEDVLAAVSARLGQQEIQMILNIT